MYYYALSDIHGEKKLLEEAMEIIDIENASKNKIIFLGDYIDNGPESCQVLYYIKELVDKFKDNVIVLRGNHEEIFLEWFFYDKEILFISYDAGLKTIKSFLTEDQTSEVIKLALAGYYRKADNLAHSYIRNNHKELLLWLKNLPYFYETDTQIFVHAGVDEEAEELWKYGTSKDTFVSKFPAETGFFYKDIIAGHISTSTISGERDFNNVYWDGKSHFYIDGCVEKSRNIPVLKYNADTKKYTSFRKKEEANGNYIWEEYVVS